MKKEANEFFKQTGKAEMDKLSGTSFPGISDGVSTTTGKIFTAADMWNIHAKGKKAMPRRWSI